MRSRVGVVVVTGAAVIVLIVSPVQVGALVPRTTTGVLVLLGLVAACLGWARWLVPRMTRRPVLRPVLSALPVLALLTVVLLPAVVVREVDEGLLAGLPAAALVAPPTTPGAAASPSPPGTAAAPPAPQVERLSAGAVRGVGHRASGEAVVHRVGDTHFVRLQDLDVQGAVDVVVYLVPGRDKTDPDGGVELGPLKGTRGDANYLVPTGADPADYGTVLLWCRAFSTPIAVAPQSLGA